MSSGNESEQALWPEGGGFGGPRATPWRRRFGVAEVLAAWKQDQGLWRNVADYQLQPATAGATVSIPDALSLAVRRGLQALGIERLYTHQARAYELAREGHSVVIATPTASGKSLCYNLPVLDALAKSPASRALYLFPTKALSRDQEQALGGLASAAGLGRGVMTYDGDTPGDARRVARARSSLVLTNPEMLHTAILPHHAAWAQFLAQLRYVVVDELHTYRGVFGSHLVHVLRRLCRAARFHGSEPVFLFASATIGNPREHASRMLGREVVLVDRSSAPTTRRHVVVYNPPLLNPELGIRANYLKSSVRLSADLVSAGACTLVFGQSRNAVEVMLKYLRERVRRARLPPESIQAYRGGYLPHERRRIEQALREGRLRCVVATHALELGIDVGQLDAVVCAGYPGTLAGLWQRFGRAGRRGQGESLALLVTSSAPLDQYVARASPELLGRAVEQARIDPDNVEILVQHLKCAAFELPFEDHDRFGDVPEQTLGEALAFLADHKLLHPVRAAGGKTSYHWATDAYPANHVSLRSAGWDNFVIVDVAKKQTLAEMDWRSAHTMLHEQAIYQHAGEQYQVERLDFEHHKAYVRRVESEFYTQATTYTRVSIVDQERGERTHWGTGSGIAVAEGEISVVEKVVGYKKIKYFTHENVGYGEVRLPEMQMHTSAIWLTVPEEIVRAQPVVRPLVIEALRGIAHALRTVAALGLMTDPRDVGYTLLSSTVGDETAEAPGSNAVSGSSAGATVQAGAGFDPTIFLYDRVAGGVGLAARLYDERQVLLQRTRVLIDGCGCETGCPGCIGAVSSLEQRAHRYPRGDRSTPGCIGAVSSLEQPLLEQGLSPLDQPMGGGPRVSLRQVALHLLSSLGLLSVH